MTLRRTIAHDVTASGIALHSGVPVTMRLSPAPAGHGIVFRRADLGTDIPARFDQVSETRLGTVIGSGEAKVGVVEHLMAAAAGAEIDDLLVSLDGPEPPILDGDALSYLSLLESGGTAEQAVPRTVVKVIRPVTVECGDARASLLPDDALSFSYELSFPVIGDQYYAFAFSRAGFKAEIAPARTFGFLSELETLNKLNLAKGASLLNTLALDDSGVVNREHQRFADEFVRHKILDAIGDMALAGAPLVARFEGRKSGHATNNALLRALFADSANYELREL
ncbi:MAG TPA: UDP-3-O-acyl-N-acetylglucosamine deacetylase [Rhizomicrobium sp.]|jgi:UDP-3-O-[3-hydroxymyristoyl] N-acetylglucosamine deacetylase|nr:UDP-3-O-acyl-N-acetylglucosamine deacetylase [Rhizomicrobium sp.]